MLCCSLIKNQTGLYKVAVAVYGRNVKLELVGKSKLNSF